MKQFIFFCCFLFAHISFAQTMDYSRVVTPQGNAPRTFEEQLVQWAWFNQPENLIHKNKIEIASKKVNLSWWEWLRDANASFNLNEGNIVAASAPTDNNIFFPRYNFGLTFNLGAIVSRPAQTKIAKEELKIAELEEHQGMLKVRAEVLSRYEDYELAVEILKSKTQAAQEAEEIFTLVSEQFENDKVDFKDYSAASSNKHNAIEGKAIAQNRVNKAIIALEELIGIEWEKAVRRRRKK